jgi:hypothetical protein
MMIRFFAVLFAVSVLSVSLHVRVAEGEDTIRTCALTKAYECTPDDGCREWPVQDLALPRFIRIDMKAKTIKSLDRDVDRESRFREVERPEGMLVMHGTETRGWSMALGEESDDLTLSASGDGESFVVFGSCMSP